MPAGSPVGQRWDSNWTLTIRGNKLSKAAHGPAERDVAMSPATIDEIDRRIRQLPPEKLAVVSDFVSYLLERELSATENEARATMFATEAVLRRDWDRPEEDA